MGGDGRVFFAEMEGVAVGVSEGESALGEFAEEGEDDAFGDGGHVRCNFSPQRRRGRKGSQSRESDSEHLLDCEAVDAWTE